MCSNKNSIGESSLIYLDGTNNLIEVAVNITVKIMILFRSRYSPVNFNFLIFVYFLFQKF